MAALTSLKKWVEKVTAYLTQPSVIGVPYSVTLTDKTSGSKTCTTTINLPTGYEVVKNCKPLSVFISGYSTVTVTDRGEVSATGGNVSFTYYLNNPNSYTGNLYLCGTILCYRTDVSDSLPPSEIHQEIDYVIDQGTEDIWTYRKWNSGVAECWGTRSVYLNLANGYGSLYYQTFNQDLPSGLFTAVDSVTATRNGLNGGSGNGLVWVSFHTTSVSQLGAYVTDSVSQAQTWSFSFYVIGRWK